MGRHHTGDGCDGTAIDRLLEAELPALRQFVRRRLGAHLAARETVSDVVQSACRELIEQRHRWRGDGAEGFRGWLRQIAVRKIGQKGRFWSALKRAEPGQQRHAADGAWEPAPEEVIDSDVADPAERAIHEEESRCLDQAIRHLPERHRLILALFYAEEMSHARIAAALGLSTGTVRSLIAQALAVLTSAMGSVERPP